MSALDNSRTRWKVLAILWTVMIIIGLGGFIEQGNAGGAHRPFLDNLYYTFQLGTLNYFGGASGEMNWRVNLARFVVPLLAATTILQTASVVFRDEFHRYRLRYAKGHTIVAGLGETGARIGAAFAAAGEKVVAIEPDATVAASSGAEELLGYVLSGSATDPAALKVAGIERAARLVITCGSDATNAQVVRLAAQLSPASRRTPLRCSVQLDDADLSTLLRAADLDVQGGSTISYFNLQERGARALLAHEGPALEPGQKPPHLMVVGLGSFGQNVVLALCQQWADLNPGVKLCPTLVDRAGRGRWEALRLQHPALGDVCEPTIVDLDLEEPAPGAVDDFIALLDQDAPSWVAIAFDDESTALAHAVFMHQHLPFGKVPIVVRMRTADGLGGLLAPHPESKVTFPGVQMFPFLDRTCTVETVDGGVREQLAQAVHEDYLANLPDDAPPTSLQHPWSELTDVQRNDSRARVDGILADLDSLACDLVPLRRWGAPQVTLTDDEIDQLAAREHGRWLQQRTSEGWTVGPVKDEVAKTTPLLVPWDELDAGAQAWNLDAARALLPMLARNGFEAERR